MPVILRLAGDDLIVLTPDRSGVAGAYPFTAGTGVRIACRSTGMPCTPCAP